MRLASASSLLRVSILLVSFVSLCACESTLGSRSLALETTRRGVWQATGRSAVTADDHTRLVYHAGLGKTLLVSARPALGVWAWDGAEFSAIDVAPFTFYKQGAAYDSSREVVVLFGGQEADDTAARTSQTTWLIDATGRREVAQGGPGSRGGAALAYDAARDRVVLVGGTSQFTGRALSDTWLFDGMEWEEASPATLAPEVSAGGIAYDETRERVVLVRPVIDDRGETWEWDGSTWAQIDVEGLPYSYTYSLTWDPDRERVLAAAAGELWQYDGEAWSQIDTGAEASLDREFGAIAYDPERHRVVLYRRGGTIWEHDGDDWIAVEQPAPTVRHSASTTYDADRGRLVVTGGSAGSGGSADTWEWDGSEWSRGPDAPFAAYGTGFAYDAANRRAMIVLDGRTYSYDGDDYTDLGPASGVPTALLAYDAAREELVAHGGGLTHVWGGTGWTASTTEPPTSVRDSVMAYDAKRQRIVRFGGYTDGSGSSEIDETWEWDGTEWTQVTPTVSPSMRGGGAMTYDPDRELVVLFGGYYSTQTWEYDGTTWTERVTATAPLGSFGNGMVYDTTKGRSVFYASDGQVWEYFPVGDECTDDEGCASGVCSGGVCCDHVCPGPCYVCSTAEGGLKDGICEPAVDAGMECTLEDGGVVPWDPDDGGSGDDDDDDDEGGCCSVAPSSRASSGALVALGLLLAITTRRWAWRRTTRVG